MILAAVDDLLFSSKIRATAKQVGIDVQFARTPEAIMERARELRPALAIFDLNSGKTDPIATIAALKRDPTTSNVPVIGFVSHVQVAVIEAAQHAGADQVLPRSAFAARLPEILMSAGAR